MCDVVQYIILCICITMLLPVSTHNKLFTTDDACGVGLIVPSSMTGCWLATTQSVITYLAGVHSEPAVQLDLC